MRSTALRLLAATALAALALSLPATNARAQTADTTAPRTRTAAGDRAILFTLNGLQGIDNFSGGFGGLYYAEKNLAIRLGLGLDFTSSSLSPPSNDSTAMLPQIDTTRFAISLQPAIRYTIGTAGPVVGYFGAQFLMRVASAKVENVNFVNGASASQTDLTFGAGVILGAEWFAFSNVSLGAEYQLMYTSTSGTRSITQLGSTTSADLPTRENVSIGTGNGATFILAFYF